MSDSAITAIFAGLLLLAQHWDRVQTARRFRETEDAFRKADEAREKAKEEVKAVAAREAREVKERVAAIHTDINSRVDQLITAALLRGAADERERARLESQT